MTIVPDSVLVESKSARDHQLERISPERAQQILNKLKALYFAVGKGEGTTTTELLADFYEVPEANIRQLLKTHRAEFESDGLQTLRGKDLRQVRDLLSLTSMTVNVTTWTPRAAMRLGMLLRNSAIAKALRTSLLDSIETIAPAQAQEIERLKLELQVAQAQAAAAQSQERLMQATNAIAALHGSGMVELILGKSDAIITRTEVVEKTIAVDAKGRVLSQSDGLTIGYLTKRLGFKNNEQTWQ